MESSAEALDTRGARPGDLAIPRRSLANPSVEVMEPPAEWGEPLRDCVAPLESCEALPIPGEARPVIWDAPRMVREALPMGGASVLEAREARQASGEPVVGRSATMRFPALPQEKKRGSTLRSAPRNEGTEPPETRNGPIRGRRGLTLDLALDKYATTKGRVSDEVSISSSAVVRALFGPRLDVGVCQVCQQL